MSDQSDGVAAVQKQTARAVEKQTERAVKAQVKLADSASELKDSAQLQLESADRRTVFAADRTVFAAERTYAAWIRTGLAALASGVGARSLLEDAGPIWLIAGTGTVLILFSAFCFLAAVWRQMTPDVTAPAPDARALPSWPLVMFTVLLVLVCLAALVGVWLH